LCAAREQFARCGYEGASLRDIAARASVDAALINRYFGGKDELFALVLSAACRPDKLIEGDRAGFGLRFAEALVSGPSPEQSDKLEIIMLMMHAAMTPSGARLTRQSLEARFMEPFAAWLGGSDARVRAQLIWACLTGMMVDGQIWRGALSESECTAFADRLAAMLQALVDG